jgi:hypothetical protein
VYTYASTSAQLINLIFNNMSVHSGSNHVNDFATAPEATPTSARSRIENKPTITTSDAYTAAQSSDLKSADVTKFAIDMLKVTGGPFNGSKDSDLKIKKYLSDLKRACIRAIESLPARLTRPIIAIMKEHLEDIFREFMPGEQIPIFVDEMNRLVYSILVQTCNGAPLNVVLQYERSDCNRFSREDARRCILVLLQQHEPVSVNAANLIKKGLESYKFSLDRDAGAQKDDFTRQMTDLSNARGRLPIDRAEHWGLLVRTINGTEWQTFRTMISLTSEFKICDNTWLLDNIIEYIRMASMTSAEESDSLKITFDAKTGKRFSGLNAVTSANESITSHMTDLEAFKSSIKDEMTAAVLAAITTATEMKSRVNKKPSAAGKTNSWTNCRYCHKDGHRHRDCPLSKTDEPKPNIPHRAGAARAINHSTPGFLMAAHAVPPPATTVNEIETKSSSSTSWGQTLRVFLYPLLAFIMLISNGNLSFQRNLKVKTKGIAAAVTTTSATAANTHFVVDSGASDHICCNPSAFTSLDTSINKTFQVVHGEHIEAQGAGTVELIANTTTGENTKLILDNVYFIPDQHMSLISVNKAIDTSGCSSPDFKDLTWRLNDECVVTMNKDNGTFTLNATVAAY